MPVGPILLHRIALVSFRLFRKNLGNLEEFFGQMVYPPRGQKLPVRLWVSLALLSLLNPTVLPTNLRNCRGREILS